MKENKKTEKKDKKAFVETRKRADGMTEVVITKSPQHTIVGKIIVVLLAALLGLSTVIGLVLVLIQAA